MGLKDSIKKISKRKRRVRAKFVGTDNRPRLSVFKSNREIYAQVINDERGITLISSSSKAVAESKKKGKTRKEIATLVGEEIGKKAKKKKISKVVFDRGPYAYHGQIKELAEGARKGGLKF